MRTKEIEISYKRAFKKYDNIYSYGFVKRGEIDKKDNEEEVCNQIWDEAVKQVERQIDET